MHIYNSSLWFLKHQILSLRDPDDDNLLIRESMELFKHFQKNIVELEEQKKLKERKKKEVFQRVEQLAKDIENEN